MSFPYVILHLCLLDWYKCIRQRWKLCIFLKKIRKSTKTLIKIFSTETNMGHQIWTWVNQYFTHMGRYGICMKQFLCTFLMSFIKLFVYATKYRIRVIDLFSTMVIDLCWSGVKDRYGLFGIFLLYIDLANTLTQSFVFRFETHDARICQAAMKLGFLLLTFLFQGNTF